MDDATLSAEIRAFHRFYTRILLDEKIATAPFTLPEARLLHEIATSGPVGSGELARSLRMDPAYLSRLRFKLVEAGLLAVTPDPRDGRRSQIVLTADGERAFARLDRAANAAAADLLGPLSASQRVALVDAMARIRALLGEGRPEPPLVVRPARSGEALMAVGRQSALYAQEHGWDGRYEALAGGIAVDFLKRHDPGREACFVAERDGAVMGAVFIVDAGEGIAQLRLLYVEPEARGLGLGRLLVDQVIGFARGAGYRRMRLWTQSVLEPARRLYARAGFVMVSSAPHAELGHDLTGEWWERAL